MKRRKIEQVVMVAKIAEQQSVRELNLVLQHHQRSCDRLQQLDQFKREYEESLSGGGRKSMAANQLQDYRVFLTKLNEAIEQQAKEVRSAEQDLDEKRAQWLAKSQRNSVLDQLLVEHDRKLVAAQEKAEQKEADENTLARSMIKNNS